MPKVVPEYKEQATKKILEAARSVFAEKGYHDARMEDIAEMVVFLSSERAGEVTGQTINVDGGYVMHW